MTTSPERSTNSFAGPARDDQSSIAGLSTLRLRSGESAVTPKSIFAARDIGPVFVLSRYASDASTLAHTQRSSDQIARTDRPNGPTGQCRFCVFTGHRATSLSLLRATVDENSEFNSCSILPQPSACPV